MVGFKATFLCFIYGQVTRGNAEEREYNNNNKKTDGEIVIFSEAIITSHLVPLRPMMQLCVCESVLHTCYTHRRHINLLVFI